MKKSALGSSLGLLTATLLLTAACDTATSASSDGGEFPLVFPIEGGYTVGMKAETDDRVSAFLGLPYAAPPVGELRWKPPQPVVPWEGTTYEAVLPGPSCMQSPYPEGSFYARPLDEVSEDCLYLNVWTGATAPSEKRPVMVWIHGGALTRGSGAIDVYDGTRLAADKGVVVVTINYRLGAFGYFAHPELTSESEHGSSGNYGVLDQVAALGWVQRNIGQFGGDPENVTIFGESAGSWSVNALMATPLAEGLFHRAIGQSGGRFQVTTKLSEDLEGLPSGESIGAKLAADLGAATLADLRALPARQLLEAASAPGGFSTQVVVDGHVIPDDIRTLFEKGEQAAVPVMLGSNADETTSFMGAEGPSVEQFVGAARAQYGDRADEYLGLYPTEGGSTFRAAVDSSSDRAFACQMRTWSRLMAPLDQGVYLYSFTHVPPHPEAARFGAYHAAEIAYAFDNLDALNYELTDSDRRMAETVSTLWTSFAADGVPAAPGVDWPAFQIDSDQHMALADPPVAGSGLRQATCDFLDSVDQQQRSSLGNETPSP